MFVISQSILCVKKIAHRDFPGSQQRSTEPSHHAKASLKSPNELDLCVLSFLGTSESVFSRLGFDLVYVNSICMAAFELRHLLEHRQLMTDHRAASSTNRSEIPAAVGNCWHLLGGSEVVS